MMLSFYIFRLSISIANNFCGLQVNPGKFLSRLHTQNDQRCISDTPLWLNIFGYFNLLFYGNALFIGYIFTINPTWDNKSGFKG